MSQISSIVRRNMLYVFLLAVIVIGQSAFRWYHVEHLPIQYDEASNYMLFSRKGIFFCMSYYIAPQNHIFHSILTSLSVKLPLTTTTAMRLPSFIIGILSLFGFAWIVYSLFDKVTAIASTFFFSLTPPVLIYGALARGYSMLILCAIFSLYAFIRLYDANRDRSIRYLTILGISSVIGHYTMPSYVYLTFPIFMIIFMKFLWERDYKSVYRLIVLSFIVGVVTTLLYVPVFLQTGVESLTSNQWVTPIERSVVMARLLPHFKSSYLSLFSIYIYIVILSGLFFVCFVRTPSNARIKSYLYAIGLFLISSPIILMIHSVIPFVRTWSFLKVAKSNNFSSLFYQLKRSTHIGVVATFFGLIVIFSVPPFGMKQFSSGEGFYRQSTYYVVASRIGQGIMDSQFKTMFCAHPLLWLHLQYIFKEAGYDYTMIFGKSISEFPKSLESSQLFDLVISDETLADHRYCMLPESIESTEVGNEFSIQLYSLCK